MLGSSDARGASALTARKGPQAGMLGAAQQAAAALHNDSSTAQDDRQPVSVLQLQTFTQVGAGALCRAG